MDKKKKFQNDPAKFFLYQDRLLSDEDRVNAASYSQSVVNLTKCSICEHDYDLQDRAPRILIHCGHTVCTSCLYLFFKDQRIRCPLCSKMIKRLKLVEVLPLNHQIYNRLINSTEYENIDPINTILSLPNEKSEELAEQEDYQFPMCQNHPDRCKHFVCLSHNLTLCRACILENLHFCSTSIVDLYSLQHHIVKDILYRLNALVLLKDH